MHFRIWFQSLRSWLRIDEHLHSVALASLYLQIACALIGSLGALYNGVPIANLILALLGLIAIESGNQSLIRTYVRLLGCALALDIVWLVLFTLEKRDMIGNQKPGIYVIVSVNAMLITEAMAFTLRVVSVPLWVQLYRVSAHPYSTYQPVHFAERIGTEHLAPYDSVDSLPGISDDIVGGSIYNPAYYSSLFSSPQMSSLYNKIDREISNELILQEHF